MLPKAGDKVPITVEVVEVDPTTRIVKVRSTTSVDHKGKPAKEPTTFSIIWGD